jgi:acetyl esterase/lipase
VRDFDIGSLRARRYQWRDARDTTLYFHGGGFMIGDLGYARRALPHPLS